MVELGLGKNMVRSLRFWVEAAGLAVPDKSKGMVTTTFADEILGQDGFDPFLEDVRTLWLLHWKLSSRDDGPLFAWHYLLNHWPHPEFTRSEAVSAFKQASTRLGHSHSEVTLAQHLDVFLHTYARSRSSSIGIEDSLDGPLIELALLQPVGQRKGEKGRWETALAFRREPKPEITSALFGWCLQDWWKRFRPSDETITLRDAALADSSPGQVFKLPEDDVRTRLEGYAGECCEPFSYRSSAVQGLLTRRLGFPALTLSDVYKQEQLHA